jgi:hypothetical protein
LTNYHHTFDYHQLRHLKRAKRSEILEDGSFKLEIILCPLHHEGALSDEVKTMFPNTCHRLVCKEKPRTREEYKQWGNGWPVVFRPSEVSEEQEKGLPPSDLEMATRHLKQVAVEVCLLVEPNSNQVSASVHK